MSAIKIEKNVAIPANSERKPHKTKYPFRDMEVGDSFAIKLSSTVSKWSKRPVNIDRLTNSAYLYKKRHAGWDYTTRISYRDNTVRLWRVA